MTAPDQPADGPKASIDSAVLDQVRAALKRAQIAFDADRNHDAADECSDAISKIDATIRHHQDGPKSAEAAVDALLTKVDGLLDFASDYSMDLQEHPPNIPQEELLDVIRELRVVLRQRQQEQGAGVVVSRAAVELLAIPPQAETSVHGPRMRCIQCQYAWRTGSDEWHASDCAYIVAKAALAAAPQPPSVKP